MQWAAAEFPFRSKKRLPNLGANLKPVELHSAGKGTGLGPGIHKRLPLLRE